MANENTENIPVENEPEPITPEIVDENDAGRMETPDDEFFPEDGEPPGDGPVEDENPPDPNLPDFNLIDEAAAFIRTTIAAMIENAALKIGDYLLTRFFGGDIELAISRNPYKNVSFTHLCRRTDIPLTRREMGLMVRMAHQEKKLVEMGVNTSLLFITHKRYLTQIPDSQAKYDLVNQCIEEKWPAWKLAECIREMKLEALAMENSAYVKDKAVNDYKKTMARFLEGTHLPDLLATQAGLYRLERQTVLDLKEAALAWKAGLEAKQRECEALIEKLEYTVAHPYVRPEV